MATDIARIEAASVALSLAGITLVGDIDTFGAGWWTHVSWNSYNWLRYMSSQDGRFVIASNLSKTRFLLFDKHDKALKFNEPVQRQSLGWASTLDLILMIATTERGDGRAA